MKIAQTKHFAKSLVAAGREDDCFPQLIADLADAQKKIAENYDFLKYLVDKQVSFGQKQAALGHVFQDFISRKTYNFLYVLIKAGKLSLLPEIIKRAEKLHKEERKLVEVVIESAVKLKSADENRIAEIVSARMRREIVVKTLVEKDLLGGVKVRIGDTVVDGSLRGKIMRLKSKIEGFE